MIEEDDDHIFILNRGPNQDSFQTFSEIAYKCLAETQARRPTIGVVIKELQNALKLQGETMVLSRFQYSDIMWVTNEFDETYCIGLDTKSIVYKAEVKPSLATDGKNSGEPSTELITVAIKRFTSLQRDQDFFGELEKGTSYEHPNIIITLLGFCYEIDERILVYELASGRSLDDFLKSVNKIDTFTWIHRLRMCLGIARGLNHLHTKMLTPHGGIKSANIMIDKNWEAKIVYFEMESKVNRESDIYSFGVVLFEIFCGRVEYDPVYIEENDKGLAPIARQCFSDRTIERIMDPRLKEEMGEGIFTSNIAPNQDSFVTFLKIAYQCLGEAAKRPTMEMVIMELERALKLHEKTMVLWRFQYSDIMLATNEFDETYCIGLDTKSKVYKAELKPSANSSSLATDGKNSIIVAIKRITSLQGKQGFSGELEKGNSYKHPNIITLLGFCYEGDERILVYELASGRSLDDFLKSVDKKDTFTWFRRLRVCLGIARGLNHLHTKMLNPHGGIKSANIMIDENWEAKIAYFEMESKVNRESDIYSFGVVLFEIFCGRVEYDPVYIEENEKGLAPIARQCFSDRTVERIMDPRLKEEMVERIFTSDRGPNQDSLNTFLKIAYQCLGEAAKRPTMEMVIKELERALKFHVKPQENSNMDRPVQRRETNNIFFDICSIFTQALLQLFCWRNN